MKTLSILALSCVALVVINSSAFAEECVFEETNNNLWHNDANWSCGHAPGSGDTAVLDDSDDWCIIDDGGSNASCTSFSIVSGAILDLENGRSLTITGNCVVDGALNLQGALTLGASLTLSGDGTIYLQQKTTTPTWTSEITGAYTLTLSDDEGGNTLTLIGTGEIDSDIVNNAVVKAGDECPTGQSHTCFYGGQLEINGDPSGSGTYESDDGERMEVYGTATGAATWQTTTSSSVNKITFNAEACLSGDVKILDGELEINADFCTTGDLELGTTGTGNAQIRVLEDMMATFGVVSAITCGC